MYKSLERKREAKKKTLWWENIQLQGMASFEYNYIIIWMDLNGLNILFITWSNFL